MTLGSAGSKYYDYNNTYAAYHTKVIKKQQVLYLQLRWWFIFKDFNKAGDILDEATILSNRSS